MSNQNEALKNILYLTSCVLEEDSNRNYGIRDSFLFKLHNSWEEFINNSPLGLDPYQTLKDTFIVKEESQDLDIEILSKMNKKPWKYSTHSDSSYSTFYMNLNSIWLYFDLSSLCWKQSSIKSEYLVSQLQNSDKQRFKQNLYKLEQHLKGNYK